MPQAGGAKTAEENDQRGFQQDGQFWAEQRHSGAVHFI